MMWEMVNPLNRTSKETTESDDQDPYEGTRWLGKCLPGWILAWFFILIFGMQGFYARLFILVLGIDMYYNWGLVGTAVFYLVAISAIAIPVLVHWGKYRIYEFLGRYKALEGISDGTGPPCIVCLEPISKGEQTLVCPTCGEPAHREHLLTWIREAGECPSCDERRRLGVRRKLSRRKPRKRKDKAIEALSDGTGPACMVCSGPISAGEKTLSCPSCGGQAHRKHLQKWIRANQDCPMCRRKLS